MRLKVMTVIHCIWSFEVGGAETMLVDIVNRQCRTDRVFVVIVNNIYDKNLLGTIAPDVEVVRLERRPGSKSIWWLVRLYSLFARLRPDVIHVHNHDLLKVISRHAAKALFFTAHALSVPVENLHDGVTAVAISHAVADDLKRRNAKSKIITIPNGVDVDAIKFKQDSAADGKVRLVQVGRLNIGIKGQDLLLECLARLHRDGHVGYEVHFIGTGPDRQMLEDMASESGITDSVFFHGGLSRRELYGSLCTYDIMVHPARTEGFGLVIAEGLAAGLKMVVSDIAGPGEVVDGGRRGLVVEKDKPDALARAVLRATEENPDRSVFRRAMKDLYSVDLQVERYRQAYADAINGKR